MIKQLIEENLKKVLGELNYDQAVFLERPTEKKFGDYSSPLPLRLAEKFNQSPMEIARQIESKLKIFSQNYTVEVLTPGYLNFHIEESFLQNQLGEILERGDSFGYFKSGEAEQI